MKQTYVQLYTYKRDRYIHTLKCKKEVDSYILKTKKRYIHIVKCDKELDSYIYKREFDTYIQGSM